MSRVSHMMSVGRRSMMNAHTGLRTVSHNIANKETEGYSRQRVETTTALPESAGKVRVGRGARAAVVRRINNPYVEKQLAREMNQLATSQGRQQGLAGLEELFNEHQVDGFSKNLTKFFNAWRDLSNNPESYPKRAMVKASGVALKNDFENMVSGLNDMYENIDSQISLSVEELNGLTAEMAELNQRVMEVEISGGFANDERDRRDLLIKKIGEIVDVQWAEGDDGSVTLQTASDAILVVGSIANRLEAVETPARVGKPEGSMDIVYYHHDYADPLVVTDRIMGGKIGGLLSSRSSELGDITKNINGLANGLVTEINKYHVQGYNAYNQTGISFFEPISDPANAATTLNINPEIMADVGRISAGLDPNRPGDNRIANAIEQIQYSKGIFPGGLSLADFYHGLVGEIAVSANQVNSAVEVQENAVRQLKTLRESISGVSLDEETAKMIEMQKLFDASARVIRTADEILETVINIRRY